MAGEHLMNGTITKSIAKVESDDANLMLLVRWDNGDLSRLPYVWLRDNCPEPHTMNLTSRQKARTLSMKDLDVNVKPEALSLMQDGTVAITWPHVGLSKYSTQWIQDHDISNPEIQKHRPFRHFAYQTLWNKETFWKIHKFHDYNAVMNKPKAMHDCLLQLMKLGLVFIENTPPHDVAKQMIDYFGYCYYTQYGQVNEDEGGESHLVDGFEVARKFKEAHPKMYDLLKNYEMEYYEDGEDKYRYNTASQKTSLGDCDEYNFLNIKDLRPGQIMIFDNCRLLHGRGAFKVILSEHYTKSCNLPTPCGYMHSTGNCIQLSNKERNLEGWYLNYDSVKSKLRVLHNQLGLEPNILAM